MRTGVKACAVYLLWRGYLVLIREPLFQHGPGPQVSDRVRDPARRFDLVVQIALLTVFYASSSHAYWYVGSGDVHPSHGQC